MKNIVKLLFIPLFVIFIVISSASCILHRDVKEYNAAIKSLSATDSNALAKDSVATYQPTGYISSENGIVPNVTVTDLINNIDRHLILYEIFIGLVVAILGIFISIISFANVNKVERYVEREVESIRTDINAKLQSYDARINTSETSVTTQLAANLQAMTNLSQRCETNVKDDLKEIRKRLDSELKTIRTDLSKEKIEEMVNNFISDDAKLFKALHEVLDKHYKQKIFKYTIDYNKKVIGNIQSKNQATESILRDFSKSIINAIDDETLNIKKNEVEKALDKFNTDWLILNNLFSIDIQQIKKGLSSYITESKNPLFQEVLLELQEHHGHQVDLHGLLEEAVQTSRLR